MSDRQPEVQQILSQVEMELASMLAAGETGTVTVHVGGHQLQIECNAKRKQQPVRIEAAHVAYIKRLRS